MKRSDIALVVVLSASIVCACSIVWVKLKGYGLINPTSATSETTSALVQTSSSSETSAIDTDVVQGPLTDEEALEGFTNYLHFKIKGLQEILDEGKYPCTWGIASSDDEKIMIMFKSYTGALFRYHIDRVSGKTYVTNYVVETNSYVRTKESFNVRNFIDKKPTPTPVVIKPSGETTEPAAKPKIKITNAVNKTAVVGGAKLPYKIPQVSITGKNTSAANKKMKSELGKYDLKGDKARSITYSYHTSDKLISILVHISDNDSETYDTYKVYNIAVSSGKIVKDSTAVKLSGSTTKKFFAKVKATYKSFGAGPGAPDSYAKKAQKKNLKRVSYKYLAPYVSKNGHLCFIGYVNYYGGNEKGYRVFDATTKKIIA